MNSPEGSLICITGTCGGCGASSLAAALAAALHHDASQSVLVDLDLGGPGLEVLLGIESEPGARWHDLAAARGEVDGRGLLSALPHWGAVPVVSGSRLAVDAPTPDVILDVCAGLLRAGQTLIVDAPRPNGWTPAVRALLVDADYLIALAPLTMVGSAGAQGLLGALRRSDVRTGRGPEVLLATVKAPGGQVVATELADLVGLEMAATVGFDRRLAAAVEHGLGPNVGRRSRLGRAAQQLANRVRVAR